MTSRQWRRCKDSIEMIRALKGVASDRKGRLYLCGGCRAIWKLLYDDLSREAVEVAERVADGQAAEDELRYAVWAAEVPTFGYDFDGSWRRYQADETVPPSIQRLVEMGVLTSQQLGENNPQIDEPVRDRLLAAAGLAEASASRSPFDHDWWHRRIPLVPWPGEWLLRCVFSDPFAPFVFFSPAWISPEVAALARTIYEDRAFERMPLLGEALKEAGCRNWDMIEHCHSPHPHVRGCWVVDLALGKS